MRVPISLVDASLPLPQYHSAGAAAFDFYARLDVAIEAGSFGRIPTNCIIRVPDGYVLVVSLRSSTPQRKGLIPPNGIGVIDPDYHGPDDEIQILVYNTRAEVAEVKRGERIAQGLLLPVERVEWEEARPPAKSRGGFGSTG